MSTRTETASSPRKAFVDPIQPALTVGAITGNTPHISLLAFCYNVTLSYRRLTALHVISAYEYTVVCATKIMPDFFLGTFGLLSGGAAGILRSTPPLLFSIAAGVQCFSLGTSFWCKWITIMLLCCLKLR